MTELESAREIQGYRRSCHVNAETDIEAKGLDLADTLVCIVQINVCDRNLDSCVISLEDETKDCTQNSLCDLDVDLRNIEDVAVHIDVDAIKNHIDERHCIDSLLIVCGCKSVVRDEESLVLKHAVNNSLHILKCLLIFFLEDVNVVDCINNNVADLIKEAVNNFIEVERLAFPLRDFDFCTRIAAVSVRNTREEMACVNIECVHFAHIVDAECSCVVFRHQFKSDIRL